MQSARSAAISSFVTVTEDDEDDDEDSSPECQPDGQDDGDESLVVLIFDDLIIEC